MDEKDDIRSLPKVLSCPACQDVLNKAVLLPCIHHLCKSCVNQLIRTDQTDNAPGINCPVCHQFSPIDKAKEDTVIQTIVEFQSKRLKQDGNMCEFCSVNKSAFQCTDCRSDICEQCKNGHLGIPSCKSHVIKSLQNTRADSAFVNTIVLCEIHPEKVIEFNCISCNHAICYKCKVLEHDNHKTETIEQAIESALPDVHKKLNVIDNGISSINDMIKYLDDINFKTKSRHDKIQIDIANKKADIIQKLDSDALSLASDTALVFDAKINEISKQRTHLSNLVSVKMAVKSRANTLLCYLQDVNLLQQLQGNLMDLLDQHQVTPENLKHIVKLKKDLYFTHHEENMIGLLQDETQKITRWQDLYQELEDKYDLLKKASEAERVKHDEAMQSIHQQLYAKKSKISFLEEENSNLKEKLKNEQERAESTNNEKKKLEEMKKDLVNVLEECLTTFSPAKPKSSAFKVFSPPVERRPNSTDVYGEQFESRHSRLLKKMDNILKLNKD